MAEVAFIGSQEALRAASKLIADIKRVHAPIAHLFHKGMGLELQRRDSDMAVKVMLILRQAGIAVLPFMTASRYPYRRPISWKRRCGKWPAKSDSTK
jgi:hypothetical protein